MDITQLMKGVSPNLGPFADALGPKLIMLLGVVWLLCMAAAVALAMKGGVEFAGSRSQGRPMAAADGVMDIGVPIMGLVFLAIIPAIVTAVV